MREKEKDVKEKRCVTEEKIFFWNIRIFETWEFLWGVFEAQGVVCTKSLYMSQKSSCLKNPHVSTILITKVVSKNLFLLDASFFF